LKEILETISIYYTISEDVEITLEGNPDDLTDDYINTLKRCGINRLSIGIQTLDAEMLVYLNRAHTATQAERCIKYAQDSGITDISIDLIYALPSENHLRLERDIQLLANFQTPHLSAYCLTIEPQTVFGKWVKQKKLRPQEDSFAAQQYEITVTTLRAQGFEQYEISNFARNNRYSQHNTAYWQQKPYLGIGPGAHSFNGTQRCYNISNNIKYIKDIQKQVLPATIEQLSSIDQYNEYILTGLRTKWGCDLSTIHHLSNKTFAIVHGNTLQQFEANGWIQQTGSKLLLTETGKLFADYISSELFLID
jgi:oxygen-independent coproporphyrinogen-3 oxidase